MHRGATWLREAALTPTTKAARTERGSQVQFTFYDATTEYAVKGPVGQEKAVLALAQSLAR